MPDIKSQNGVLAEELEQLFGDAEFLFKVVTQEEFEQTMRMTNTDIAVDTIDWRNAKSVAYLRSHDTQSAE